MNAANARRGPVSSQICRQGVAGLSPAGSTSWKTRPRLRLRPRAGFSPFPAECGRRGSWVRWWGGGGTGCSSGRTDGRAGNRGGRDRIACTHGKWRLPMRALGYWPSSLRSWVSGYERPERRCAWCGDAEGWPA